MTNDHKLLLILLLIVT